jgi:hypothetical protein
VFKEKVYYQENHGWKEEEFPQVLESVLLLALLNVLVFKLR